MASASASLSRFLIPPFLYLLFLISNPENVSSFSSTNPSHHRVRSTSSKSTISSSSTLSITSRSSSSILHAKKKNSNNKNSIDEEVVTLIHSHHLLDHKPDNMILTGKKYKLRGIACIGRPGVALCIGSTKNANKFAQKLKGAMPQKKFGVVEITTTTKSTTTTNDEVYGDDGNEGASSSSEGGAADNNAAVAILDGIIEGFERASLAELRELLAAVGREDQFLTLVGMDATQGQNNNNNSSSNKNNQNSNSNDKVGDGIGGGGGKGTGKKKKRKKK